MKKFTIVGLALVMAVFMMSAPVLSQEEGGVRGIKERLNDLEKIMGGVEFSGAIELEAGYVDVDFNDPGEEDETSSDLSVPTAELAIDAGITNRIKGHILFTWEDDEGVGVDEAIIHYQADEVCVPNEDCYSNWYDSGFSYVDQHYRHHISFFPCCSWVGCGNIGGIDQLNPG